MTVNAINGRGIEILIENGVAGVEAPLVDRQRFTDCSSPLKHIICEAEMSLLERQATTAETIEIKTAVMEMFYHLAECANTLPERNPIITANIADFLMLFITIFSVSPKFINIITDYMTEILKYELGRSFNDKG